MKVYKNPNLSNKKWKCPICKTREDKEVVLLSVAGTEKGYTMLAEQVHVDCLDLFLDKENNFIFQRLEG